MKKTKESSKWLFLGNLIQEIESKAPNRSSDVTFEWIGPQPHREAFLIGATSSTISWINENTWVPRIPSPSVVVDTEIQKLWVARTPSGLIDLMRFRRTTRDRKHLIFTHDWWSLPSGWCSRCLAWSVKILQANNSYLRVNNEAQKREARITRSYIFCEHCMLEILEVVLKWCMPFVQALINQNIEGMGEYSIMYHSHQSRHLWLAKEMNAVRWKWGWKLEYWGDRMTRAGDFTSRLRFQSKHQIGAWNFLMMNQATTWFTQESWLRVEHGLRDQSQP